MRTIHCFLLGHQFLFITSTAGAAIILVLVLINLYRRHRGKKTFFSPIEIIIIFFILLMFEFIFGIPMHTFNPCAKQSEAKHNLTSIFIAQKDYFTLHHSYASGPEAFALLNWEPEGSNQYAYFCGEDVIRNTRCREIDPRQVPFTPPLAPASSAAGFTCMAVGNIDNDKTPDYWSVNDRGELRNEPSDL